MFTDIVRDHQCSDIHSESLLSRLLAIFSLSLSPTSALCDSQEKEDDQTSLDRAGTLAPFESRNNESLVDVTADDNDHDELPERHKANNPRRY